MPDSVSKIISDPNAPLPAVSIIITAYNVAAYIAETLDSVFNQTFTDFEAIVVNDGSPDTPELEKALEPYRDRIVYIKRPNGGASAARNTGIQAARAPLIATLDGDDVWLPHYLETQLRNLSQPGAVLSYGNALRFGAGTREVPVMDVSPSEGEVTYEKLIRLECNVHTSVMAKKDVLIRAGLYDEAFRTAEDFDLWLRVAKLGAGRIVYTREILTRSRVRPGSLSWHQDWMHEDFVRVLNKHQQTMKLTAAERNAIEDMKLRYRAEHSRYRGKRAFDEGDARSARIHLKEANQYYRSRKLSLMIVLLRLAPGPLVWLSRLRNRPAAPAAKSTSAAAN